MSCPSRVIAPVAHVVEARDQAGQRGLAHAGRPHQRDDRVGRDVQVDVLQHRLALAVAEAHVLERQRAAAPAPAASIASARLRHLRLLVQQLRHPVAAGQRLLDALPGAAQDAHRLVEQLQVEEERHQVLRWAASAGRPAGRRSRSPRSCPARRRSRRTAGRSPSAAAPAAASRGSGRCACSMRSASRSSCVNALISRMPERLSFSVALSSPSSCCRSRKAGRTYRAKLRIASTISGIGSIAQQRQLPVHANSTALTPISVSTLTSTSGMAWAISCSNMSESLTIRDISWPVCLSS